MGGLLGSWNDHKLMPAFEAPFTRVCVCVCLCLCVCVCVCVVMQMMQRLGKSDQTRDEVFEEFVNNFHKQNVR